MNNLNSVLIEGNMVRDPLHRTTPKGTSLCTFSLASNRSYKGDSGYEQEVAFLDIETWAKLADQCYNLGRKGRGVRVIGRLRQERWVDADGKNRSKVAIVAEHVEFKPDFKNKSERPGETDETAAVPNAVDEESEDVFSPMLAAEQMEYETVSF